MAGKQLEAALERLDLLVVGRELGLTVKTGLQRSPFPEGHKHSDRKPSFSVFGDGRWFKDHATGSSGGAWDLTKLARPSWSDAEVAVFLIKAAGMEPEGPPKMTHHKLRTLRRSSDLDRERRWKEALTRTVDLGKPESWPEFVQHRFEDGSRRLRDNAIAADHVAAPRGWYTYTVTELAERGMIADPILPWSEPNTRSARRGVAFPVHWPVAKLGTGGADLDLVTVGYHQRFETGGRRSWVYVPHCPSKTTSRFQQDLAVLARSVPALPYVVGNLARPALVVVLEGQWDAISFYAAAGGEHFPGAVFGLRGAQSVEPFLAGYAGWLRALRPAVWLIRDNDDAGRRWCTRRCGAGGVEEPSVAERIKALGASRVVTSCLASSGGGMKDFNDWYREALPEPEHMQAWAEGLGLPWGSTP